MHQILADDLDTPTVGAAQLLGRLVRDALGAGDEHEGGAPPGERAGERGAQARGRAGDQRGLAREGHAPTSARLGVWAAWSAAGCSSSALR